jgi:hypothetical protein
MTTATELQVYIDKIGKDNIFGINFDNSKRVARREREGGVESFDDRFVIDTDLDAVVISEKDQYGIPYKVYLPIDTIQAIYAVDNPADVGKIDKRYTVG